MHIPRLRIPGWLLCNALFALPLFPQIDLGPSHGSYGETDWGDFDNDGQEDVVYRDGAGCAVALDVGLLAEALDDHIACTDFAVARRDGGESLLVVDAAGLHDVRWNTVASAAPYFTSTLLAAGVWSGAKHLAVGEAPNGDSVVFGIGADGTSFLRATYTPGALNLNGTLGTTAVSTTTSGPYSDLLAANLSGAAVEDAVLVSDTTIEVRDGACGGLQASVQSPLLRNECVVVLHCATMAESLAVVSSLLTAPAVQLFTVLRLDATGPSPLAVFSSQQVLGTGLGIHALAAGDFLPSKDVVQTAMQSLVMDELAFATSNSADLFVVEGNRVDGELLFDFDATSTVVLTGIGGGSSDPAAPVFVDADHDGDEDLIQILASQNEAVTHENAQIEAEAQMAVLVSGVIGDACGDKAVVVHVDTRVPPSGADFLEVAWWHQPSPTAPLVTMTKSLYRYSVAGSANGYLLNDGLGVPTAAAPGDEFDGLYFLVLQYVSFPTLAEPYRYPPQVYVVHASAEGSAVRNHYKEISLGDGQDEAPFWFEDDLQGYGVPDPCPTSVVGSSWHMAEVPSVAFGVTVVGGGSQTPQVPGGAQPIQRP